ncbi:MAG: hypothetical protein Q9213_003735 [Squamulea squamosa]
MFVYQLMFFPLTLQLLLHAVFARVPSPQDKTQNQQELRVPLPLPVHAPPEPWNEEICRSGLHPNVHLTFSWGEPLHRTRLYRVLRAGQKRMDYLIGLDPSMANHPILEPTYMIEFWEEDSIILVAKQKKHNFRYRMFTLNQLLAALDMMELCGLARGIYQEMWAYVFVGEVQVGYVYVQRIDIERSPNQSNGTLDASTS